MTSCTAEQLNTLLDFLENHRDLARGLLRSADGRLRAKRLWHEVSELLNSLGGSVKSVPQWQKVWADRKHLAKKNAATNRRSVNGTGGGPGSEPLTSWEMKVLSIMGEGFGAPATTARVPVMLPIMNFQDEVAMYATMDNEEQARPSSASQHVEEWVQNSPSPSLHAEQQARLSSPELSQQQVDVVPAPQAEQRNTPARRTRRRRTVHQSLTQELLKNDERKIEVLTGLKEELHGLTAVVKELVDIIKSS